jgi:DNA-binding PadR family transcriptional regulator
MRQSGPPKGLTSYLVLELLSERPRYGYEIIKEIRSLSGGHWEPSYGSLYPLLSKFEEEGWAERVDREDEPDRKYFRLTAAGEETLADKRAETGGKAREFADVVVGFHRVYVALATDERFAVDCPAGEWQYDEAFSAWMVERMIRHHERAFGSFERTDLAPEAFARAHGLDDGDGSADGA